MQLVVQGAPIKQKLRYISNSRTKLNQTFAFYTCVFAQQILQISGHGSNSLFNRYNGFKNRGQSRPEYLRKANETLQNLFISTV